MKKFILIISALFLFNASIFAQYFQSDGEDEEFEQFLENYEKERDKSRDSENQVSKKKNQYIGIQFCTPTNYFSFGEKKNINTDEIDFGLTYSRLYDFGFTYKFSIEGGLAKSKSHYIADREGLFGGFGGGLFAGVGVNYSRWEKYKLISFFNTGFIVNVFNVSKTDTMYYYDANNVRHSVTDRKTRQSVFYGVTLGVEQYASMRVADNVDIYADLALDIAVFSQELQKNTRSGDRVSEEQSALTKSKFKEGVRLSPSVGVSVRF